ncbi:hypothetical protein [Brachybacterium paraconglomeratum]|uniref:hypothetical protein n=1 Tax=Brachybacterium paraconglomeratum TaxID=173362 RepID=UPI0024934BFD|nr:hypothetical protein [Brachybacterium paraconglomeratum]
MNSFDTYRLRPGAKVIDAHVYSREGGTPDPAPAPSPRRSLAAASATGDRRGAAAPYFPCPECERAGHPGRIGSRRRWCPTCSRWGAAVNRNERRIALAELAKEDRLRIRLQAQAEAYAPIQKGAEK